MSFVNNPPVSTGGGGTGNATPTIVPVSTTYTIPADTQMLFKAPCKIDGVLKVTGTQVQL